MHIVRLSRSCRNLHMLLQNHHLHNNKIFELHFVFVKKIENKITQIIFSEINVAIICSIIYLVICFFPEEDNLITIKSVMPLLYLISAGSIPIIIKYSK